MTELEEAQAIEIARLKAQIREELGRAYYRHLPLENDVEVGIRVSPGKVGVELTGKGEALIFTGASLDWLVEHSRYAQELGDEG